MTEKERGNSNSRAAHRAEEDEFYTQLSDVEKELKNYTEHFKGKVVYCNCDDPYESNFFKYFILNFNHLGLKKLITTCYAGSPIAGTELKLMEQGVAYKIEVSAVDESDGFTLDDAEKFLKSNSTKKKVERLKGDGDFRSEESVALLKESDIVVTTPPPSLFAEFVAQLLEYKKDFLIIGRLGASTTMRTFPLIKENKLWLGLSIATRNVLFWLPPNSSLVNESSKVLYVAGRKRYGIDKPVRWFTTLDYGKRHEKIVLYETYSPEKYPHYDNYDAINVDVTNEIPCDYDGVMGVPITFLDKYNPEQFEILGCSDVKDRTFSDKTGRPVINGKKTYVRIFVRRK